MGIFPPSPELLRAVETGNEEGRKLKGPLKRCWVDLFFCFVFILFIQILSLFLLYN
jgi:hypothetical protein